MPDAAIKARVSVNVVIKLWLQIVAELKVLIAVIISLKGKANIFGALDINAIAVLFVDIVAVSNCMLVTMVLY